MNVDNFDANVAAIASKVTYTGAGTSAVSWIFSSEFGIAAGILLGTLGWLTNVWFQHRRDKREQEEHQQRALERAKRMAKMVTQPGDM